MARPCISKLRLCVPIYLSTRGGMALYLLNAGSMGFLYKETNKAVYLVFQLTVIQSLILAKIAVLSILSRIFQSKVMILFSFNALVRLWHQDYAGLIK